MKKEGRPVSKEILALEAARKAMTHKEPLIDFSNTEIAFRGKSDEALKKAHWLFKMMNKRWLVDVGSKVGLAAIRLRLPFVDKVVKSTIFEQFCGGTTLLDSQPTIEKLYAENVMTILDYGAEGKETEEAFNITMNECIRAIEFAAEHESAYMVSTKITGMAAFDLLEKIHREETLTDEENYEFENVLKRVDSICHTARQKNVSVAFDAEETWIQKPLDSLVNKMMARYNQERPVVYNTFQLYRHDRLQYLIDSFNMAKEGGFILGAKLVRGAYMEKERNRAREMGYPSPIHPNKEATDDAYNMAVRFCVENYEQIACMNATHNANSCLVMAQLIEDKKLPKEHTHFLFCQLLGMSDHLSFNLADAGYRVAKYVPYGSIQEVVPYLIRRAQENASVTGDMGRELELLVTEMKRRGHL